MNIIAKRIEKCMKKKKCRADLKASSNGRELGRFGRLLWRRRKQSGDKRAFRSAQQFLVLRHNVVFVFVKELIRLVQHLNTTTSPQSISVDKSVGCMIPSCS